MPSVGNQSAHEADAQLNLSQFKLHCVNQTLAAGLTIQTGMSPWIALDPGGAGRTIIMPSESANKFVMQVISNEADAAEDLTIRNSANSATIATISQDEVGIFFCDGVAWRGGVLKET